MRYSALFDLEVRHSFYADGRCPDFAIEASAATRRLLRNHRCLLRARVGGVRVVTALDEAGQSFLPLPADATLRFHLRLLNGDFALFTDLASIAREGEAVTVTYPVPPRLRSEVFAEVEVRPGSRDLPASKLEIGFAAKQARWAYYCVTDLPANGGQLEIVDTAPEPLVFSAGNRRELGQEPDPADRIALQLAQRYPGLRRLRFVSDQPVACRQEQRRNLELRLGGERLSGPLPNPSPRSFTGLEIAGDTPGQPRDSLFQIVKYSTQPFPNPGE